MQTSWSAGVVIEKDGKYWGSIYSDGQVSEDGWIDDTGIAYRYDADYAGNPLDCISPILRNREKLMKGARFVKFTEESYFVLEE